MPEPRSATAALMGDPPPDRLERSEARRLSLPEPRPEIPLSEWIGDTLHVTAPDRFVVAFSDHVRPPTHAPGRSLDAPTAHSDADGLGYRRLREGHPLAPAEGWHDAEARRPRRVGRDL